MKDRSKKALFHFKEGKTAYEKQQYSSAVSHLKMAVALDPLNEEAKKLFKEVEPIAQNIMATTYFNKARMEEELGNYEVAANLYTLASEVLPNTQNLIKASQLHAKIGSYSKAKELAIQAANAESTLKTETNLINIYIEAKMYNRAKSSLEKLMKRFPDDTNLKTLLKQVKTPIKSVYSTKIQDLTNVSNIKNSCFRGKVKSLFFHYYIILI
jgi:tetratricopeptide (TPR) repeat protein